MRYRARLGVGIAALLVVAGAAYWFFSAKPAPIYTAPASASVQYRDCNFSSSYGAKIDCYWVPVDDGLARLSVAIFRGEDGTAADPLVYLAGGPGETGNSAPESLALWDHWLAETNIQRDFVLLDLRGASPSEPFWDCDEYTVASRRLLKQNLTFAEEGGEIAPILEACLVAWRDELRRRGGPVEGIENFSSQQNARDLAGTLRRLNYRRWNYLAVSYGTRVALLAAMQQPEVQRIILDSPYPLERGSITDSITLWATAFERFWRRCGANSCEFTEDQFWSLMAELRKQTVWVEVEDWQTGRMDRWLLNDGRLAAAMYTAFYSSELTQRLAAALGQFVAGDQQALMQILEVFFNQAFDSRFNSALYWATECNDNVLGDEAVFAQTLAAAGPWERYFSADWRHHICRSSQFRPAQLPVMESVSAPILVAVGGLDPITTETHARELMQWLPNGYLLVQPEQSHAEFFMSLCGQDLITWFLQASPEQLMTDWQDRVSACQAAPGETPGLNSIR